MARLSGDGSVRAMWDVVKRLGCCAIALAAAGAANGEAPQSDYHSDDHWQQVCTEAKARPLPTPVTAGPLAPAQLPTCNERALYYGFAGRPDYAAALQCGWYEENHPQTASGNMFYGDGVLAMLYANGFGVPRNYDAAIGFACRDGWAAEAEMALRVGHLEHLRDTHATSTKFDLCDDITSGLSMGFCTGVHTGRTDTTREREIEAEVQKLPTAAQAEFPQLQAAEDAFAKSRASNEIDLSGTARGMFALEEEDRLKDQFLINLRRFGKGDVPAASAAQVKGLDGELNAAYRALEGKAPASWQYTTINAAGVRTVERAWVALEEEWMKFSGLAYPRLTADQVRAELIRLRLHQLKALGA